jgi:hypothetical protein
MPARAVRTGLCLGVSDLPLLGRGRNYLYVVTGEVKYKI